MKGAPVAGTVTPVKSASSVTERPAPAPSREIDLLLVIYLTVVVFAILYPVSFFSRDNLRVILNNLAVDGILAVGMMTLMIAGVFDLSVGSMLSLAGVVTGWLLVKQDWPVALAAAGGLAVAGLGGLLNGWLVARARVNALIATLGTLGIFQGLAILVTGPSIANLPAGFTALGQTELLGLQLPVWFLLVLAAATHYLLRHTRYFRQFYYVGSNAKAARLSGINVERVQRIGFALTGLAAGAAGLAFAARVGTAVSTAGVGTELRVITAVILGGASLSGGKGSIAGALTGVVFMALINNVLIIARVSSYWQGIVVGVILVLAVALDSYQNRRRKA
jgi:ribose transport system permease protein